MLRGRRFLIRPCLFCPRTQVPDFNVMYELYDPCTIMFFFRNKHIMIDLGTGNNNKVRRQDPVFPTLSLVALADCLGPIPGLTVAPFHLQTTDQLPDPGQAGGDRHHRDGLPRGAQGPGPGGEPEGLQHKVPVLSRRFVLCCLARCSITETGTWGGG